MAIKKNELYSSLWESCDKLRGGMDASQYKDYILTLLFVKYVTDKFKGQKYADINVPAGGSFDDLVALKNNKDIGEKMDKAIAKLAEANNLTGVIDNAKFFDNSKFGNGKEEFARYKSESGLDAKSVWGLPEFVDPSIRDYRLKPGSFGTNLATDGGPMGARNMPGLDKDQSETK